MIAHLTDADLLTRIRAKLAVGALPVDDPVEAFGGQSTGQSCAACDELIAAREAEIEVTSADVQPRFFHPRCYNMLAVERFRLSTDR